MAAEGFGLLQPGAPCRLEFDADGVAVRTVGDTGYVLAASIPFADMLTLRVGGPGAVASNMGPGWLDGGIGSEQEIPDGLHATALDNLTTPVGPESILQLGARGFDARRAAGGSSVTPADIATPRHVRPSARPAGMRAGTIGEPGTRT